MLALRPTYTGETVVPDVFAALPPPVFSSENSNWQGFWVRQYRLPAIEIQEQETTAHHLTLELGNTARVEITQNGDSRMGRLAKGEVTYTPAGGSCGGRWEDDREVLKITFNPDFFARATQSALHRKPVAIAPQFGIRDPLIESVGLALASEAKLSRDGDSGYARSLATVLAAHLQKNYSRSEPTTVGAIGELPAHTLHRATEFINTHLGDDIALIDIAGEVKMSPYHFSRMFKKTTGTTPQQYVLNQKIDRAKILLVQTPEALADIAHSLSFSSQSHFTAHFHRVTGVTPKAYRSSHRGSAERAMAVAVAAS